MAATITIQVNQQSSGNAVTALTQDLRTLDTTARGAGGGFTTLGATIASTMGNLAAGAIANAAGAMAKFAGDSISAAGDFEASVNNLAAVSGTALADAGFSFDDVSAKALQLGQDTAYSANEAITAMTNLVKGGVPVAEVMGDATDATLALAAAGGVDLANAADIVSKQLGVWATEGLTARQAADLLAQAANASTIGVEDLAQGLSQAGGTAKTAGVSYNELVQSMALLAPGFSSAADAGTSFKTFLSRLIPTTNPAKEAMAKLGLYTAETGSAFYDAQGNFIGMEAAAGLLQEKTAGLSEEQRLLAFNTIFGADAIRAAAGIATAGAEGFNAMGVSMAAAGTAASTAAIQNQGFNFAMDSLKGTIETVQIQLGSYLLPFLTQLATTASTVINAVMGNSEAFAALSPQLQAVVTWVQGLVPLAQQLGAVIAANWQPILAAVGAVISAVVIPALVSFAVAIAPVVAAVGLAIAIGYALYTAWTSNFMGIQGIVFAALTAIQAFITSVLSVVLAFWQQNGAEIMAFAQTTWTTIQQIIGTIAVIVATIIRNVFNAIAKFIDEHGTEIQTVLETAWNIIQTTIETVLGVIQGIVNTVLAVIQGDWQTAQEEIQGIIDTLVKFLTDQFNNILKMVTDLGPDLLGAATDVGSAIIDGIKEGIGNGVEALKDAVKKAAKSALDAAKSALGIKSPSAVFAAEIGGPIVQGMALGMVEAAPMAEAGGAYAANAALGGARSTVNRSFTYAPTIYSGGGVGAADITTAKAMAGV